MCRSDCPTCDDPSCTLLRYFETGENENTNETILTSEFFDVAPFQAEFALLGTELSSEFSVLG